MNNKTFLVLYIIGSVTLGVFIGYFAFLGVYKDQLQRIQEYNPLASRVLTSWSAVASGKVIEVAGHTLTLSSSGEIFATTISEDAEIYLVVLGNDGKKVESVKLENIAIGDNVDILLRVEPTGGVIEGYKVTILQK